MNTDDAGLAARARNGDSKAFTELVSRHQDRVFRFVFRMIGSREEAMDITQDSFVKAWQAMPRWRPDAQFGTWLLQIARNAALDVLRRGKVVAFEPLDADLPVADPAPTPEERVEARSRVASLDAALRMLAPEHREVLLLREVEDLSYAEIAQALGVAEGTVKSRIARARAALLAVFAPAGGTAQ
ncbi:MAG: RNA polymerase sigma factor [Burkholderiaceae bacterium]|nr:RNA polymerase sigma factor [Burkholderiaceae bacterium]MCD6675550.1 RNA polymerase sigma factor [Burkholderiaceae bacterium]